MDRLGIPMRRRNFIAALAALGVSPFVNAAETKTFTMGLLWIEQKPSRFLPPLVSDVRARGYEQGRNLRILDFTVSNYDAGKIRSLLLPVPTLGGANLISSR